MATGSLPAFVFLLPEQWLRQEGLRPGGGVSAFPGAMCVSFILSARCGAAFSPGLTALAWAPGGHTPRRDASSGHVDVFILICEMDFVAKQGSSPIFAVYKGPAQKLPKCVWKELLASAVEVNLWEGSSGKSRGAAPARREQEACCPECAAQRGT